jgi:hypothetical protein
MFSDKTMHNVHISKAFTYYLRFIDELYHLVEDRLDIENKQDKAKLKILKQNLTD